MAWKPIDYEAARPRQPWGRPWDDPTPRELRACRIAGAIGACWPFALLAIAYLFTTPSPGNGDFPTQTWADVLFAYSAIGSYLPCISCPSGLLMMWLGYKLLGTTTAWLIAR